MWVASEQVGDSLLVRLAGELDLVTAEEFKQRVDDLLDRQKVRNVFVNLEQVTFLDSSFLGALLGRYRRVQRIGGQMGVVQVPPTVRPMLEISGVFRVMGDYRSEQEALAAG